MKLFKESVLFLIGGLLYIIIELLYRQTTHWTMFLVGGICFILIGLINEFFTWDMLIWVQMVIATGIILIVEFISGCILNIWLGLNVWDYSGLPFNLLGQISLYYSIAWFFLSFVGIWLDDVLRYRLFGDKIKKYRW